MSDDAGTLQAQILLRELDGHVVDISNKLEAAEARNKRSLTRGITRRDLTAPALRRELYEVHRLIDALHRRYPLAHPVRQEAMSS